MNNLIELTKISCYKYNGIGYKTGLKIKVIVDNRQYNTGKKVSDEDFDAINIQKNSFEETLLCLIR